MTYVKRYPGGFLDRPATTTPADSAFLNALETELIRLGGHITNADIDAAAAIAKSKLAALAIVDADVSAISASKITPGANGQWIKTSGGAVVWSAIQPSDIAGYPADGSKSLKGDGAWTNAGSVLIYDSVDAGVTLPTATIDTGVLTIPSGAKHLLIEAYNRDTVAAAYVRWNIRFNNDSAANYYWNGHEWNSSGAAAGVNAGGATAAGIGPWICVGSSGSDPNTFGSASIFVPHAFNTANYKNVTGTYYANATGANAYVGNGGGRWVGTAAINRIQFLAGGSTWAAGTRYSVYAIF